MPAGLPLQPGVLVHALADGLAVGHLRPAGAQLHAVGCRPAVPAPRADGSRPGRAGWSRRFRGPARRTAPGPPRPAAAARPRAAPRPCGPPAAIARARPAAAAREGAAPRAAEASSPVAHPLQPAERHQLAGRGLGTFCASPPGKPVDAADPVAVERRAVLHRAAPDPRQGQPAGMAGMHGCGIPAPAAGPRRGCRAGRRSAAGPGTSCRSAFHSRWMPLSCSAAPSSTLTTARLASPRCSGRRSPRRLGRDGPPAPSPAARRRGRRALRAGAPAPPSRAPACRPAAAMQLGGCAAAVAVGAFADHIDIAGHRLALADRHLAQHQRCGGSAPGAPPACRAPRPSSASILLTKTSVGVPCFLQPAEAAGRARRRGPAPARDHHRGIGDGQRAGGVMGEFDRAGTVEDRPGIAEIAAMAEPQLGPHAARRRRAAAARRRRPAARRTGWICPLPYGPTSAMDRCGGAGHGPAGFSAAGLFTLLSASDAAFRLLGAARCCAKTGRPQSAGPGLARPLPAAGVRAPPADPGTARAPHLDEPSGRPRRVRPSQPDAAPRYE